MRVLSYNIRYGGTGREKQLAEVINSCEPDLVILQEATHPDVVSKLGELCGMSRSGSLRGQSLAFLSRRPVVHHAWHRVPLGRRRYLDLLLEGSNTRFYGVHLSAIHSNLYEQRRFIELGGLLRAISQKQPELHVVTGDFNTLAPGEKLDIRRLPVRLRAIVWLTGRKLRFRTIQRMLAAGYVDGYRTLHPHGDAFTFPTWSPQVRLDFAFLPAPFSDHITRCEVVRDAPTVREASDHFPLLFEIS